MAAAPPPTFPPTKEATREFVSQTMRGVVAFRTTDVPPPSPIYVQRDDLLLVRVWNSVAGANVQTAVRLMLPSGEIIPQVFNDGPTADRVTNNFLHTLAEGFVLSITTSSFGVAVRRGQTFVNVFLFRGLFSSPFAAHLLISDYVTNNAFLGWPYPLIRQSLEGPGMLRTIGGTTPAAGAEISEQVPSGARWLLRHIRFQLTTSAAVANRNVRLVVDDTVNIFWGGASYFSQLASTTNQYSGTPAASATAPTAGDILLEMPMDVRLFTGNRLRTLTPGLQAADAYTAPIYQVEEWIEP